MLAAIRSAAVLGIDAYDVGVEVDVASGLPHWTMMGSGDPHRPPLGAGTGGLPAVAGDGGCVGRFWLQRGCYDWDRWGVPGGFCASRYSYVRSDFFTKSARTRSLLAAIERSERAAPVEVCQANRLRSLIEAFVGIRVGTVQPPPEGDMRGLFGGVLRYLFGVHDQKPDLATRFATCARKSLPHTLR